MATFTVPTTGVYTNSRTGGRFRHIAGAVIDLALAVDLGMPGAALPAAGPPFRDAQVDYLSDEFEPEGNFAATDHTHEPETQARTATATGATTGTISDPTSGQTVVTVTSDSVNKIIALPDAAVGSIVVLFVGATGYELATHAPATVGINAGVGAAAESAIPANTRTVCQRATATNWLCSDTDASGFTAPTEAAAP